MKKRKGRGYLVRADSCIRVHLALILGLCLAVPIAAEAGLLLLARIEPVRVVHNLWNVQHPLALRIARRTRRDRFCIETLSKLKAQVAFWAIVIVSWRHYFPVFPVGGT